MNTKIVLPKETVSREKEELRSYVINRFSESEINEFLENQFEEPIYRLSAIFDNYGGKKIEEMEDHKQKYLLDKLKSDLQSIQFSPSQLFVEEERKQIEAAWYFPFPIIFNDEEQFFSMILNFERFINEIRFSQGVINLGILSDDPDSLSTEEKNFIDYLGLRTSVVKLWEVQK